MLFPFHKKCGGLFTELKLLRKAKGAFLSNKYRLRPSCSMAQHKPLYTLFSIRTKSVVNTSI